MSEELVHVGYRQKQQSHTGHSSEIWNYHGLEFNHIDAKRRGFIVQKVYALVDEDNSAWNRRSGDGE